MTTPVTIKPSCCEAVRLKLRMYFYTAADEERVAHVGYDASRERKKPAPEPGRQVGWVGALGVGFQAER